jgi:hypothetical protein
MKYKYFLLYTSIICHHKDATIVIPAGSFLTKGGVYYTGGGEYYSSGIPAYSYFRVSILIYKLRIAIEDFYFIEHDQQEWLVD